jgi:hypothetical protein
MKLSDAQHNALIAIDSRGKVSATWLGLFAAKSTVNSLVRQGLVEGCSMRSESGGFVSAWRLTRDGKAELKAHL